MSEPTELTVRERASSAAAGALHDWLNEETGLCPSVRSVVIAGVVIDALDSAGLLNDGRVSVRALYDELVTDAHAEAKLRRIEELCNESDEINYKGAFTSTFGGRLAPGLLHTSNIRAVPSEVRMESQVNSDETARKM